MAQKRQIYGKVENKADLKEIFSAIRGDVAKANSRPRLTELYKRAGYLNTLTRAPSWKKKFGTESPGLRKTAEEEFAQTARRINRRAKAIGTDADYDESWGE